MLTDPLNEIEEQQVGRLVRVVTIMDFDMAGWCIEAASCPGNPELVLTLLTTRITTNSPKGKRYAY